MCAPRHLNRASTLPWNLVSSNSKTRGQEKKRLPVSPDQRIQSAPDLPMDESMNSIYRSLWQRPQEKDVPPGKDVSECYFNEKWGFTIYRTVYGTESDKYWHAIVNDLQGQIQPELDQRAHGQPEAEAKAQEILSLFRLDVQSDEKRLAGLTMQQIREHFLQACSNEQDVRPMRAFDPPMLGHHLFLLVDEEVISAAASGQTEGQQLWVKCVDADYRAENYVPRNTRVRQIYFGWMKMTTRSLVEFQLDLDTFSTFERIAPPMRDEIGMDGQVWDGDTWY